MDIILLEKIRNLGDVGQVVNVKDGYGRNFLLKFGKALRADKKNIEYVNRKRSEINKKNIEQKKIAKEVYEKIKKNVLFLTKKQRKMAIYMELLNLKKYRNISQIILNKQYIHHKLI